MASDNRTIRAQLIIAAALVLFGFGLVTQLISREQLSERLTAQSEPDLIQIIDSLDAEISSIRSELTDLQVRFVTFSDKETGNQSIINRDKSEIADLKLLLGAESAEGPGIVIEIRDRQRLLTGFDLRQIIEEIRSSGAWAIAVNGRRLDERASFWRSSGSVYINGSKLKPVFKIEAIGDADLLFQAITLPRGIRDKLGTFNGVTVSVKRRSSLRLPAVKSPARWRWIKIKR